MIATRRKGYCCGMNIPARLHGIPPATFSGGEQQRVNLARGFHCRPSDPAAGRTDRVIGCGKPGGCGRHGAGGESEGDSDRGDLP